jgi:hypothetical protein
MALALLANTSPRLISLLGANPGVWSATVSGDVGAFPTDAEILAAQLEADEWVAVECYFQSVNQSLSTPFEDTVDLVHNDSIPYYRGKLSRVELGATDNWKPGIRTDKDAIINAVANESHIETGAFDFLYALEDNVFFTTAIGGRVTLPTYTRTSILQCNKNEESLIIFRAAAILVRNASPALFDKYQANAEVGRKQIIEDGAYSGGDQ